jgi:hypothetical protein
MVRNSVNALRNCLAMDAIAPWEGDFEPAAELVHSHEEV